MSSTLDGATPESPTGGVMDRIRFDRVLLAILGAALILRVVYFVGFYGADDASLASAALSTLQDGFRVPQSHYTGRIGLILPQAALFAVFGTGEWQMAVLPLGFSILGIWMAYAIGGILAGRRVGLIAAIVLALFPLELAFASSLYPDLPLGAMLAVSVYWALRARTAESPYPWAIASGLAWGYAYLIKIEAGLLLFVFLAMVYQTPRFWRTALVIAISCGCIFLAENAAYFAMTGRILHRLRVIAEMGGSAISKEYSGGSLWGFPKAWFVTFYQFGLHYYLLLFGSLWAIAARRRELYLPLIWLFVYLGWLQFGGNPFSGSYSFKSHLQRYCLMVGVPMAIVVAAFLHRLSERLPRQASYAGAAGLVAVSLFMINFNVLGSEREEATKLGLRYAVENKLFPLYLDKTSFDIADFLLEGRDEQRRIHPIQRHDFRTGRTQNIDLRTVSGYVLLNRGFMLYKKRRYFMDMVEIGNDTAGWRPVHSIDNPMNGVAYAQARLLRALASLLPSALRTKIAGTTDELLMEDDVVILGRQGVDGRNDAVPAR